MSVMKARFYTQEISQNDPYKKVRRNLECIINAALYCGGYSNKYVAYHILGSNYLNVVTHLKSTTDYSRFRKYKIVRNVINDESLNSVLKSYHYKNLKLERIVIKRLKKT